MENKEFPPLDPENALPEVFPEIPEQMELLEETPVIEDLTFEQDSPAAEPEDPIPEAASPEQPDDQPILNEVLAPEQPDAEAAKAPAAVEGAAFAEPETAECFPAFNETPLPEEAPDPFLQILEATAKNLSETPEPNEMPPLEEPRDQEYRDDSPDFDKLMQTPVSRAEQPTETETAVPPKGRPKRKKGEGLLGIPSILATFVWLALIVIIGVTAGRMLWICAADVLAFGREDKVVTVTVYEADTMEDIIDKLHEGGLIRYKSLFSLYADISDAEEDIKPGIYDLNTRYDYHALVNFMSPRSSREVIKLTIPEGYTCRQIFDLLEENRICTAVDAAAYAASGELSEYWFLEGLERGTENCLEGYLFPDTYEFYKNSTPREAIERMLDNFEYRFDEDMVAQLEAVNDKYNADYGIREIVIIASLIEKESAAPGESPTVSGVIYNRLFKWGSNPPLLNIDASIVYAQDGDNSKIDTKLDHPYNTYLYEGLTPGPIANPGLASLKAALNPEKHNYYYYVLNPSTGMHQFSTTYQEHQGYVREFNASPEIEIE